WRQQALECRDEKQLQPVDSLIEALAKLRASEPLSDIELGGTLLFFKDIFFQSGKRGRAFDVDEEFLTSVAFFISQFKFEVVPDYASFRWPSTDADTRELFYLIHKSRRDTLDEGGMLHLAKALRWSPGKQAPNGKLPPVAAAFLRQWKESGLS